MRVLIFPSLFLLTFAAFAAGCVENNVPSERAQERAPKPNGPIEKLVGTEPPWHGTVSTLQVAYVSRLANLFCQWGDVCVPGDNERYYWVSVSSANKMQFNLTWDPVSPATEQLGFAIRHYDWTKWDDPEQEIRYVVGTSPLKVKLEGEDLSQKSLPVRIELVTDEVVTEQPFRVDVTYWDVLG